MTKSNLPANQLPYLAKTGPLDDVLYAFEDYLRATFHCNKVGIIQSFDTATQRATVQLVDVLRRDTYQGQETKTIKPLLNCPVILNFGKNGGLNFPIKAGMECQVYFNDRDLENWKKSGAIDVPPTYRMHDISDAICIIGPRSLQNVIANYDNESVGISYLSDEGELKARVKCSDKVEIANDVQSLKDLISTLISTLQSLKTVNGAAEYPIDAATSSELTTLATNFNALLK